MTDTARWLVDALAVYRLTRLATADVLLDQARDRIVRSAYERTGWNPRTYRADANRLAIAEEAVHANPYPGAWADHAMDDQHAPKLATLVTCRWCASVWVAAGVVLARRVAPRAWRPVATVLAYSAGAALLAGLEDS